MARLRTIKPEFWSSEQIATCSRDARLLFIGLWNFCDDAGVHPASYMRLKMQVFPADNCSQNEIANWINELIQSNLIIEYQANDGKKYWYVTGWDHQKIARPYYKYPKPNNEIVTSNFSSTAHAVNEQSPNNEQAFNEPNSGIYIDRNINRGTNSRVANTTQPISTENIKQSLLVQEVFKYWQETLNHPRAKLDKQRKNKIIQALKIYSMEEIKLAIDGCKASSFHQGKNPENKIHDDIELILRDARHVEQFMSFAKQPLAISSSSLAKTFEGVI